MRRFLITVSVLVVLAAGAVAPAALADPGSLDPTFGTDGVTYIDLGTATSVLRSAVQPDGSVLAICEDGGAAYLVRLTEAGVLDTAFGTGGRTLLDSAGRIWVQPLSGRIIIDGRGYTAAGLPDATYGSSGHPLPDEVGAMAPDGAFVWVGASSVTRLTPDGAPDTSFGVDGTQPLSVSPQWTLSPKAAMVDDQGRIVVSGDIAFDAFVLRLSPDGALDAGFNGTGFQVQRWWTSIRELRPATGDRIYAVWASDDTGEMDEFELNRVTLSASGADIQAIFGANSVTSWTLMPDGSAIVGGRYDSGFPAYMDISLRRFTPLGLPDETFAPGGRVVLDFGSWDDSASIIARLDGRILIAGTTQQAVSSIPSSSLFAARALKSETLLQRGMIVQLTGGRRTGLATKLTRTPISTPVTLRLKSGRAAWKTTGFIKCGKTPVGGVRLTVIRSRDGRSWSSVAYGKTGVYGSVTKTVTFTRRGTYYVRWKFAGTTSYVKSLSKTTKVVVK